MRTTPGGWHNLLAKLGSQRTKRMYGRWNSFSKKRLCFESLEQRQMLAVFTVNVDFDEDDGVEDNEISLRDAIFAAANAGPGNTIKFHSSLNDATIALDAVPGEIAIDESLTIDASMLPDGLTVDASSADSDPNTPGNGIRIFNITDPTNGMDPPQVTMIGLTLTGADPAFSSNSGEGGAIRSAGQLVLRDMDILNNNANEGAGVFLAVAGGGMGGRTVLDIQDSRIEENSALGDGGAVWVSFTVATNAQDTVQLTDSVLSNNDAGGDGGALFIDNTFALSVNHSVVLISTTLNGNEANNGGAAFSFTNSRVDFSILQGSTISGNESDSAGGGVYLRSGLGSRIHIDDSAVSVNTSGSNGGGLQVRLYESSSLLIEESTISGNIAQVDGGGFFAIANTDTSNLYPTPRAVTVSRSLVSGNTAFNRGGGLYTLNLMGTETLVEESRITGNHAPYWNGGGVYAYLLGSPSGSTNKPRFTITGSTVDDNDSDHEGGGIFVCAKHNGEFIGINSTVSGNQTNDEVSGGGGGIIIARLDFTNESIDAYLRNMTITKNTSASGGGVKTVDLVDVRVRIANSIISDNFNHASPPNNKSNLVGRVDIANSKNNLVGTGSSVLNLNGQAASLDNTNITGSQADTPGLGPLQDNGGPTPTHRLESGSPAIDAGSDDHAEHPLTGVPFDSDQRGAGFPRIYDVPGVSNGMQGMVDIGAYEIGTPKVVDVRVSSPANGHSHSFAEAIDSKPDSGIQLLTIPVFQASEITLKFSEPMDVDANFENQFQLRALSTVGGLQQPDGFDYDPVAVEATWSYSMASLPGAVQFLITLDDSVTDLTGTSLDGEWLNPASITTTNSDQSEFPSGNGTAGGTFQFLFTSIMPNTGNDNWIAGSDLSALLGSWGETVTPFTKGDFNGNGVVEGADLSMVLGSYWGVNLNDFNFLRDVTGDWKVTQADVDNVTDLNDDGDINQEDIDIVMEQMGLDLSNSIVS